MESKESFIEKIESTLKRDQKKAFHECITGHESIFCTGQGGTGKTFVLKSIIEYFRTYHKEGSVGVTASTGIASFIINGITLHKFVGAGIMEDDVDAMVQRIKKSQSFKYWLEAEVLIIDEISMVSAKFFESISTVGSILRNNPLPFGGIRLLMFGDFLQLPPINKSQDEAMFVFETDAWKSIKPTVIQLNDIVRQSDSIFKDVLSGIRYGICSEPAYDFIQSLDRTITYDDGIEPIRLFSRKDMVNSFNHRKLEELSGEEHNFMSTDSGDARLLNQCPVPQNLCLKIGAQVMLMRNLDQRSVNGTMGILIGFERSKDGHEEPRVRFVTVHGDYFERVLSRVSWENIDPKGKLLACRMQFPIILAWAVTIHKSQGATIPRLCVDMTGIFEYGQAYVALSRCPDPDNLTVHNFDKSSVKASYKCVKFYQDVQDEGKPYRIAYFEQCPFDDDELDRINDFMDLRLEFTM